MAQQIFSQSSSSIELSAVKKIRFFFFFGSVAFSSWWLGYIKGRILWEKCSPACWRRLLARFVSLGITSVRFNVGLMLLRAANAGFWGAAASQSLAGGRFGVCSFKMTSGCSCRCCAEGPRCQKGWCFVPSHVPGQYFSHLLCPTHPQKAPGGINRWSPSEDPSSGRETLEHTLL